MTIKDLLYSMGDSPQYSVMGTSLVVQGLRLHAPSAGGPGLIPGQAARSHMPQLKVLRVATKTHHSPNKQTKTLCNGLYGEKMLKRVDNAYV